MFKITSVPCIGNVCNEQVKLTSYLMHEATHNLTTNSILQHNGKHKNSFNCQT